MSTRATVTIACGSLLLGLLLGAAVFNIRHDWADVLLVCSVLLASTIVEHARSRPAPK